MATLTVYSASGSGGTTCDGWMRNRRSTWETARSTGATSVDNPTTPLNVYCDGSFQFNLHRTFCSFDTSAIGSNTISSATLSLAMQSNVGNSHINIFASTQASAGTLAASDFLLVGDTAFSTATATNSMTVDAYTDYALNASGISNINGNSASKFAVREIDHDVNNVSPVDGSEDWWGAQLYAADAGTLAPKLVVTYSGEAASPSPSPSVSLSPSISPSPSPSLSPSIVILSPSPTIRVGIANCRNKQYEFTCPISPFTATEGENVIPAWTNVALLNTNDFHAWTRAKTSAIVESTSAVDIGMRIYDRHGQSEIDDSFISVINLSPDTPYTITSDVSYALPSGLKDYMFISSQTADISVSSGKLIVGLI